MHNDWQACTNPRSQYLYTTKQSSLTEKKVKINQEAEPYRYNNFFDELKKNISLKTAFLSHPNIYSGDHQLFRIIEKKKIPYISSYHNHGVCHMEIHGYIHSKYTEMLYA